VRVSEFLRVGLLGLESEGMVGECDRSSLEVLRNAAGAILTAWQHSAFLMGFLMSLRELSKEEEGELRPSSADHSGSLRKCCSTGREAMRDC